MSRARDAQVFFSFFLFSICLLPVIIVASIACLYSQVASSSCNHTNVTICNAESSPLIYTLRQIHSKIAARKFFFLPCQLIKSTFSRFWESSARCESASIIIHEYTSINSLDQDLKFLFFVVVVVVERGPFITGAFRSKCVHG